MRFVRKACDLVAAIAVLLAPAIAQENAETPQGPAIAFEEASPATNTGVPDPTSVNGKLLSSVQPLVDGYVAAHMVDGNPPGMFVVVATPDDALVLTYGTANFETGEPVTPETLFRIASISKTFVWTAVMMLVDEGRLDLDADVNLYLKNITIPDAFDAPVTLNDLMAHRAGFEDTIGDFFSGHSGQTTEEMLIAQQPKRVAPPGVRASYSNWGTTLASQIIADVTGVSFEAFLKSRILSPVSLNETTLHDPALSASELRNPPDLDARIARAHVMREGAPTPVDYASVDPSFPAGAFSMTPGDAARWMQFFLNEGAVGDERLLSPQAFAVMRGRHFSDQPRAPGFAHGFMEAEVAGYQTFGHGGTLAGFISNMTIAPDLEIGIFVAANAAERPRIPDAVSDFVIRQFAGEDAVEPDLRKVASAEEIAAAKDIAGLYLGNRRVFSKFEKIGALGGEVKITAREDGSIVVSNGGSQSRYYPMQEDLWVSAGRERIAAYRDEDGRVVRFAASAGTNSFERIGFMQSSMVLNAGIGLVAIFAVTTLMGGWRRQGGNAYLSSNDRALFVVVGGAAFLWLIALGVVGWGAMQLSAIDFSAQAKSGWPPAFLSHMRSACTIAAIGAIAVAAATPFAWTADGWSVWRKAHLALFAAAGLFAVYAMWQWRLILAPLTQV